ncbi:MAG: CotH kinase family protein [Bacteroidetes bacterium]|nr:CotH kinase family protein [Bacteroidota bacterium]
MKSLLLAGIVPFLLHPAVYGQNFYDISTIQHIEITFSQSNWDYILDTAKTGSDSYTLADWVEINGVYFDSVGVKYKGNSSYNATNTKNPLHIELDHFKSQDYNGTKDIKLSNGFHDPSTVREVYLYYIARQYMPAPRANYTQVIINGQPMGLYTNVEAITGTFLADHFFSQDNPFIFADSGGCGLTFPGSDSTLYYTPYTLKSDYGYAALSQLCDTLENNGAAIENILDVDRTLWMLAFDNVTVTLDSYLGNSKHNYYLYQDENGRFNPIVWDLNGGLGGFSQASPGPGLSVAQLQTLSPTLHATDSLWPLVSNLLQVPMYRKMYIAHMRTILNENFVDSVYYNFTQNLQAIIDTAYQSDLNAFYSYYEFTSNLTDNVIDGPKTIPGLTYLMEERISFLNSTTEFQQIPPVIASVTSSDDSPPMNSTVFITADVSNTSGVFIGTRNSITEKFVRQPMFDDGAHGDGAPGDNLFGVEIAVGSGSTQYYIYAENTSAGVFSPERAEYEYYLLEPEKGVVINEIMADNQTTQPDSYGEYNDWVELYNNSSSPIDLGGYYLSDDLLNPAKWTFPAGSVIEAGDFLIVWTDADSTQIFGLHTNFKLAASGEAVILSDTALQSIDQILFSDLGADITFGRYPNGTGPFMELYPSYNALNSQVVSIDQSNQELNTDFTVYPNPATDFITIATDFTEPKTYVIYNSAGTLLVSDWITEKTTIPVSSLSSGVYFVRIGDKTKKLIIAH